jgi:hypothetical protein
MDFDSPIFDNIRIKPNRKRKAEKSKTTKRVCEFEGCSKPATHKAPAGRDMEGVYRHFCIEHVREYNKNYNYFNGMKDNDISDWQKSSHTGHRPTWKMGVNRAAPGSGGQAHASQTKRDNLKDPFNLFGEGGTAGANQEPKKHVGVLSRRAFETLGLETSASAEEIKKRYKELVKRHHPDANGGDRTSEERLRAVIQAHGHLKTAGFC